MITEDFSQVTVNSFFESIGTLRQTDLRPALHTVSLPTLGIYGRKDIIVNPNQHRVLAAGVPQAQVHLFQKSGHFVMLDEPEKFHETVLGFLRSA